MNKNVIGVALALTITGGLAIANDTAPGGSKPQPSSANTHAARLNPHAARMDACPYYPSPVFCRSALAAHNASRS